MIPRPHAALSRAAASPFPALIIGALALGCDGPAPDPADVGVCTHTTCTTGCCAPDGRCRRDDDPAACGSGGRACVTCLEGEICEAGACAVLFADPAQCTAETCRGCCSGNRCVATTNDVYCGAGGGACGLCAFWEACTDGRCAVDPGRCGPHNCAGCCEDGYTCIAEPTAALCGSGGLFCENCPEGGYRACVDGICVE